MKLHVFFSVHERLFGPISETLRRDHGVESISGFVWGRDQKKCLERDGVNLSRCTVFTTDILDSLDNTPADTEYLSDWERRCGVPLQHMIFAERHLLAHRSYEQVLRLAELIFRRVEADFIASGADAYFSEDVSCLTSYIHWAVARDRGARIVLISNARFPKRVTAYANPYQQWDLLDPLYPDTPPGAISNDDLLAADSYIKSFRERPVTITGLQFRARLDLGNRFDLQRLTTVARQWAEDPRNPTLRSPGEIILQRGRRLARNYLAEKQGLFDRPQPGERFVLFPLHLQPEATTLVLAPYYLNQVALVEDIAKSLPAGFRLYVKDHIITRGRWPLGFLESLRRIPAVRLLSATENTIALIRDAAAVSVITGTAGFEALLLDKPAITFGHVFYNRCHLVHRAGLLPKHEWPTLFRKAIFDYRSQPDELRRFIACAYKATFPGVTGNPSSLPEILEPTNVAGLVSVVSSQLGLSGQRRGAA